MSIIHEALKRSQQSDRQGADPSHSSGADHGPAPTLQEIHGPDHSANPRQAGMSGPMARDERSFSAVPRTSTSVRGKSSGFGDLENSWTGQARLGSSGWAGFIGGSQMIPAVLGGGSVILAALITYLLTKPSEITVIVPPPERVAVSASNTAIGPGGATAASADPNAVISIGSNGANGDYIVDASSVDPAYTLPYSNSSDAPRYRPAQIIQSGPDHPPMAPMAPMAAAQNNFGIPVFMPTPTPTPNATPVPQAALIREPSRATAEPGNSAPSTAPSDLSAAPTVRTMAAPPAGEDLPPAAITIEMTDARLESFSGPVSINGAVPHPGERLHVGTEIKTAAASVASVGFARANVDLSGASSARISRLERRIGAAGTPEEDVTLHLADGSARTVVRPGGGSVLISTDQVTASSQAGAFTVSTRPDGAVTVANQGGTVNLVASSRQGETYILKNNERVTYKNGVWTKE